MINLGRGRRIFFGFGLFLMTAGFGWFIWWIICATHPRRREQPQFGKAQQAGGQGISSPAQR